MFAFITYIWIASDLTTSYFRLKFGSGVAAASMPGAQESTPDEMSEAARLKFGEQGSGSVYPGAHDGSDINTTAAERMKVNTKSVFDLMLL